jgi:putative Holliday junction resolvase
MRTGVRLGIDVGTVRIGVARSDVHGMLATPVETVARGSGDRQRLLEIASELAVMEIVVGLPLALSGRETASTADARSFAESLARATPIPVRMVDERLSTVSANAAVRTSGRSQKQARSVIDQVAAVIILQHALDHERSGHSLPGSVVPIPEAPDEGSTT